MAALRYFENVATALKTVRIKSIERRMLAVNPSRKAAIPSRASSVVSRICSPTLFRPRLRGLESRLRSLPPFDGLEARFPGDASTVSNHYSGHKWPSPKLCNNAFFIFLNSSFEIISLT